MVIVRTTAREVARGLHLGFNLLSTLPCFHTGSASRTASLSRAQPRTVMKFTVREIGRELRLVNISSAAFSTFLYNLDSAYTFNKPIK
uniref:Uncharacterized protein n=1 Tax=Solanum tuberosum TaxID=4113 RepID=M1DDY0_SOLTU